MKRVTTAYAAKKLQVTPLVVRKLMEQQKISIGFVVRDTPQSKGNYIIYDTLLDATVKDIEQGGGYYNWFKNKNPEA